VPPLCSTRQINYIKKLFAGCLADTALGNENTKKIKKTLFAGCPRYAAPGKENLKKIKKSLSGASDMALGKARADGAAPSRPLFFAGCRVCTRQSLCRVPDKKHPAKKSLPTNFLPEALCRVQSRLCRVLRLNPVVSRPSPHLVRRSAFTETVGWSSSTHWMVRNL
jgi:hypothetical protein